MAAVREETETPASTPGVYSIRGSKSGSAMQSANRNCRVTSNASGCRSLTSAIAASATATSARICRLAKRRL